MAQVKGKNNKGFSSVQNTQDVARKTMAWKDPRTLVLQKNSQGFGFTLRHFIVYPPESVLHTNLKDEENGNGKGGQRSRLEPMDTIFVKNVKEKSPAHQAGLCKGDRLVKVNGESVLGKTYSHVIALIQTSEKVLELSIMPKDEDVLQLVYSQDAYLRGNQPYTGEAQNLPKPPPVCNPSSKPTSSVTDENHGLPDNMNSGILVGSQHAKQVHSSSSAGIMMNPLDFHFANHNAAIGSALFPHHRNASLPQARSELCNQALSDWYYSQAEVSDFGMSHHHQSISQDKLCELRLALGRCYSGWTHSTSQDTLLLHYSEAMGANHSPCTDSYGLGKWGQSSSHSCSDNLLAAYSSYEQSYGHSLETLEKASALISPHYKRPELPIQINQPIRVEEHPSLTSHHLIVSAMVQPSGWVHTQQPAGQIKCSTAQTLDDQTMGYHSYSTSLCQKGTHRMQQSYSYRDTSYTRPYCSWTPTPKTIPLQSMSISPHTSEARESARVSTLVCGFAEEPVEAQIQKVLLRQKPPCDMKNPSDVRQPHYGLPMDSEPLSATRLPSDDFVHKINGGIPPSSVEQDSLAAIPFIGNIKNSRRSSYLLAIATERSKSFDEGLNTFKEEGHVFFRRLPKRVKSFFTDGSLESLQAAENARSKRHSTSELGNITLTHIRKEGWLYYKQILTEKGKKVGGGMRPWKRVYTVLHSDSLFLFKDKREAVLHAAGAGSHGRGQGEDEQPISIQGCLTDIAYSETKRKHTLRLMTQDFCEYLLQAEDRDDMLTWIRVIRENSKTDNEELGFSRQALINKKLNDYWKQSPTGNKPDNSPKTNQIMQPFVVSKTENTSVANRALGKDESAKASWGINIMKKGKKAVPKAFGVRLEDCLPAANNKIVETCCQLVEKMGLEYTGIYRVPGNNAMVSSLQDQLNKGINIDITEERWQDLNVISSLLKSFFRKLPEPLFTDDKYNDFIEANRLEDTEDRLKTMRKLIHDLPDHYYHTLKFLIAHLKTVADHSEKNKMEPRNLALVFGPTLVRNSEDNMTDMVTHMPDRYKITETLILHHAWFFSDELDKDEKTPQYQEDIQPIPNIDHLLSNIGRTVPQENSSDFTNSDSANSKGTSTSTKDLSTKDFLSLSVISAVTRKRKKHQSTCPAGSSTDEDSEHEPIKTSNYEEISDNSEVPGNNKTRQSRCPAQKLEAETEEHSKMKRKPGQMEEDYKEKTVAEEENIFLKMGRDKIEINVERQHMGHKWSQRPQSFLFSHDQKVRGLKASSQPSNSSSSTCSNPSHSLNIIYSLTRRKMRGERVRPHSLYVERSETGEDQSSGAALVSHTHTFSRVKASLVRGQEKLRQAVSPRMSSRKQSPQQGWICQDHVNQSAYDLWGAESQRRAGSAETCRGRQDWRRHTVLVTMFSGK